MLNKKALSLSIVALLALGGCRFWDRSMQQVLNDPFDQANAAERYPDRYTQMAPLATPRSIVVCRSKQCAPIRLSMSKEYIYNSLVQMMKNNNHERVLICSADVGSHNCYQNYVSLPIDRVWTFEIDDSTAIAATPLAGLLQTFAQQADYEAAQLSLVVNPLIKIFTGSIPYHNTDSATIDDAYKLSLGGRAMFQAFWNNLMAMTHTGGTALYTAPVEDIKSHDFAESSNANDVSSSFLQYGSEKSGLAGLIPATSTPHAGVEEYSAKLESRFADRIYRTLEKMYDHLISTLNLKQEWELKVFGSVYLDDIIRANAMKLLDKGDLSQHFILAALDNMSVLDRLSLSHAVKGSGLLELLIPPATAYTQSNKAGVSAVDTGSHASGSAAEGVPPKDESDKRETKLEKTIAKGEVA